MKENKVVIVKTRGGKILRLIKEHYLRDDIDHGIGTALDSCPENRPNSFCGKPHWLLPDTNVFLHNLDAIEHEKFQNIIVLQTVLSEVKRRSGPNYKKLRGLIGNDKRAFVFVNEFCAETFAKRVKGESTNDYNDRLIRRAVAFYNKRGAGFGTRCLLLTNDKANAEIARKGDLEAVSFKTYVGEVVPEVFDKVAGASDDVIEIDRTINYQPHFSLTQIQLGVKSNKLIQGKLEISRDNYLEGLLRDGDRDILIQGRNDLNRAMNEDIIAVRLKPQSEWSAPSSRCLDTELQPGADEAEATAPKMGLKPIPTGEIVGIIKRAWRNYCGVIEAPLPGSSRVLFLAAQRQIPKVRIETRQVERLVGQRLVVAIDGWNRKSRYPNGHLVKVLGNVGDKKTENEVLLLEHDVKHDPFSPKVLSCLPNKNWVITPDELAKRVDLRHYDIASVDPPGCTDIDDALHCKKLENGNFEVGVHIADVSHFIKPGTALDEEAAQRGTSVYLADNRIDMVPLLLSSNLCSLRGGEERLAFSVIWELNDSAEIKSVKFHKSVIKSKSSFTYEEAQIRIDDKSKTDTLTESLRGLNYLAKKMKAKRLIDGALTLASVEVRFHLDSETADPIDLYTKELKETNSMVEEFMLLANCSVATHIKNEFPQSAVLRRHPKPPVSNFDPLVRAGNAKGFHLNVNSSKELAESLDAAVDPTDPMINTVLRVMSTRSMMQAVYFCTGFESDFWHYGLACPIYTHFTSPIRRYADIMVHRALAASIGADTTTPDILDKNHINNVCKNINFRNRMAQQAQRASIALHTQLYFRKQGARTEEAYVMQVKQNAIGVLIPQFGMEGTIFLNDVEKDAELDEENCELIIKGTKFKVFDKVKVLVTTEQTGPQHERVRMKLVDPVVDGLSVTS